ncbi:Glycoside hydrolase 35, catalytic domain [Dillenia turbinata]|uniref:Beta-galactosidase n=1 Tax=Dillenia turbinata TaxID=194707 RepID=A0AAN8VAN8_9MAGN
MSLIRIMLLQLLALASATATLVEANYFKPFNVSYDHRAIIIDGRRRMLISAGIHYPRATPEMWPDLIYKSKEGGADVIQTYVFWNGHEPVKGQYNFEGGYDIIKFVKLIGSSGLYLHLRIGPYVCAEWNFGGFPVWLRDIPGIEFRTDNKPFKEEMERFVKKIVDMMRDEMLFSWQGGPIIMLQIENEYGNVEGSYGERGKEYVKWAAAMALGLGAGVPWVMCQQSDAPNVIINSCNGFYCDGFKPNSYSKPTLWTEDWNGWFAAWGGRVPHRPVEDIAFAVARFFQRGGSFHNYYMYFGGTNFGRTSGGPLYTTSYDYDAPIDEYGLLSQPKWGHLKDLHAAVKLCEPALVAFDSPQYIKLGANQEAHVYGQNARAKGINVNQSGTGSLCAAFLSNIDEYKAASVTFMGQTYNLPPWSVSILPDCRTTVFNSAKVGAQTWIKAFKLDLPPILDFSLSRHLVNHNEGFYMSKPWRSLKEPIDVWSENNFTVQGILEHLNVTKDVSDYLNYITRIYISDEDILFWEENKVVPMLTIDRMRDLVHIFVNGQLTGTVAGHWVKVVQPLHFTEGYNDLALLSETVGLQELIMKLNSRSVAAVESNGDDGGQKRVLEIALCVQANNVNMIFLLNSFGFELPDMVKEEAFFIFLFSLFKISIRENVAYSATHRIELYCCLTKAFTINQNYNAFFEQDGAGFRGQVKLSGFKNGDIDLTKSFWTYQVGLKGEYLKIFDEDKNKDWDWTDLAPDAVPSPLTWYKTYFDAPAGEDPVSLDMGSMGKGQAWVNGHSIGRFWLRVAPKDGCDSSCNYRGPYHTNKCTTNCGEPTQRWYHVPRSWLKESDNLLVIFEEIGGNPFEISIGIICAQVSESHYPPLERWFQQDFNEQSTSTDMTPIMKLECEDGQVISSISFASYGTPKGSCQNFSSGSCHAPKSLSVVSEACQGRKSCSIGISNSVFGGDPCRGVVKTLAVEATCISSSKFGYSTVKHTFKK